MKGKLKEQWEQLCEKATVEQDSEQLRALIREINQMLYDKEQRLFLKVGFLRVVGCQKCNKEFLIEDDMLKKVAQLWRSGKVAVLIWATNLDFVGFVDGAFC